MNQQNRTKILCMDRPADFYVYIHRRSPNGRVFYVGKGKGNRAWSKRGRSRYWQNIVAKYSNFSVEVVISGIQEWFAFEVETSLIAFYGRDALCNLTDGGDGTSGWVPSKETRRRLSEAWAKNPLPPMKGKKHSDEAKRKMAAAKLGKESPVKGKKRYYSPDAIRRMSESSASRKNPRSQEIRCMEENLSFRSSFDAAKWVGIEGRSLKSVATSIWKCAKGLYKTSYGYSWNFVESLPDGIVSIDAGVSFTDGLVAVCGDSDKSDSNLGSKLGSLYLGPTAAGNGGTEACSAAIWTHCGD